MSQCIVPNWNLKQQIQEAQRAQAGGDRCSESDVQGNKNNNPSSIISPTYAHSCWSSKYGVAELKWENGQLGMYGLGLALGGLDIPSTATTTTKPAWKWNDTLESIVHQATSHNHMNSNGKPISLNNYLLQNNQYSWRPKSVPMAASSGLLKKRTPEDDSDYKCTQEEEEEEDRIGDMYTSTATASVSAAFWRDNSNNDTTNMMTCPSYDSPATTFNTKTTQEDSAFHAHAGPENQGDQEHDQGTKSEKNRFLSSRRSRAAAIHNQSERRRRDRINQKIKALQRLVPNASKTDKASMLEEVIDYIKQLQLQVQLMSSVRYMPQMMVPLGLQQQHQHHLQMSLLAARMGMGVGLGMGTGMFDMNTMATAATARSAPHQSLIHATAPVSATTPTFIPTSPFIVPPMNMITQPKPDQPATAHTNASSVTLTTDPYHAFLSQVSSMNVELYNKMSALYRQQLYQMTQHEAKSSSPSTQSQGD